MVLYTKVDAQRHKLATDDRHRFVILTVHLRLQHMTVDVQLRKFSIMSSVWNKVPEERTLILEQIVGSVDGSPCAIKELDSSSRSDGTLDL